MRLFRVCFSLIFLLLPQILPAQTFSAFSGLGLGYDAFIRNKEFTKYGVSWPFNPGPQFVIGGQYYKGDGFGIIFDATLGYTAITLADATGGLGANYEQLQSLVMLGSGPRLTLRNETVLMPYIQLGAGFFDYSSTSYSSSTSGYQASADANTGRWCVLFGAGADWEFKVKVPLSLNFRVVYTPLDIFSDPVDYLSATGEQLQLQGKLLQTLLTLRVHLFLKKEPYFSH